MTNKQLLEELVKRRKTKGKQSKYDLHLRLRHTLNAGIVVIPTTKQQKTKQNYSPKHCVVNKM